MVNNLIKWRPLIIGIVIILAIYIALATASQGGENSLFAFILGGIAVGFLINTKINGLLILIRDYLIHGLILGLITGLISTAILVFQLYTSGLASEYTTYGIIESLLILIGYDLIATVSGVIIGNVSRIEYLESQKTD